MIINNERDGTYCMHDDDDKAGKIVCEKKAAIELFKM